ncbi:MAG: hypothetical protein ACSLFM_12050 [Tepidiformaceae bacterium]
MSGLFLAKNVTRTDAPRIVTEAIVGVSDGRLSRLNLIRNTRLERARVEETEVIAQGEGRWLGYELADLEDGYYAAQSTNNERTTYFEVLNGEVGWFGHDEKATIRRMKRGA